MDRDQGIDTVRLKTHRDGLVDGGLFFILTDIQYLLKNEYWWVTVFIALLISQFLIIFFGRMQMFFFADVVGRDKFEEGSGEGIFHFDEAGNFKKYSAMRFLILTLTWTMSIFLPLCKISGNVSGCQTA